MKAFLLLIFIISYNPTTSSQELFDKEYQFMEYISFAHIIVPDTVENKIYIIGHGTNLSHATHYDLFFASLDLSGSIEKLVHHEYPDPTSYALNFHNRPILYGDSIIVTVYNNETTEFIIIDKTNGQIIDKKDLGNPYNINSETGQHLTQIKKNVFAWINTTIESNSDQNNWLDAQITIYDMKNDSIRFFMLGKPKIDDVYRTIQAVPNALIIGGDFHNYSILDPDPTLQLSIKKIDYMGNIIWEYNSSKEDKRYFLNDILVEPNESVLYVSNDVDVYYDEWQGYSELYMRPMLSKIDKNHQLAWETAIGPNHYTSWNNAQRILPSIEKDGYVVAGSMSNYDYRDTTWWDDGYLDNGDPVQEQNYIAKFSLSGDSLWYRSYKSSDTRGKHNTCHSMEYAPDGGYIIGGAKSDEYTDALFSSWILKLDNYGCLVPGCQVPIDTTSTITTVPTNLDIRIYPNPVSDVLYVYQAEQGHMQYHIYDLSGRSIKSFTSDNHGQTVIVSMEDVIAGNYVMKIRNQNGKETNMKIVKL